MSFLGWLGVSITALFFSLGAMFGIAPQSQTLAAPPNPSRVVATSSSNTPPRATNQAASQFVWVPATNDVEDLQYYLPPSTDMASLEEAIYQPSRPSFNAAALGESSSTPDETLYLKDKNRVYFIDAAGCVLNGITVIAGADPQTFSPISSNAPTGCGAAVNYGEDKNHVYFDDQVISGADIATFTPLPPDPPYGDGNLTPWAKDKNHAYLAQVIVGADPATFSLAASYSGSYVFDTATTTGIQYFNPPTDYAIDKNHVYAAIIDAENGYEAFIVPDADPASFTLLCGGPGAEGQTELICPYAKDQTHVYYLNQPVEGADAASFIFDGTFGRDKNHVYAGTTTIPDANPATYETIQQG